MNQQELNKVIRAIFEEGVSDPHEAAQKLMEMLTPDLYEPVLRIALPLYTRSMAHRQRRLVDGKAKPVFVPSQGWKDMADLTAAECREVAAEHMKLSEQNAARADQFNAWAITMEQRDVTVLGDLAEFRAYQAMRTREGMARAKAAGRKIGRPVGPSHAASKRIHELKAVMAFQDVVDTLNEEGVPTSSGKPWTLSSVTKIYYGQARR
jgi:hypothetical protein